MADHSTMTHGNQVGDDGRYDAPAARRGRSGRARRNGRPSRWDLPPEPRDWRFFVGHLGRILIAVGLLMFGFVAYQLWGTGIETARAQASLESSFDDRLGSPDSAVDDDAIALKPRPSSNFDDVPADPAITEVVAAEDQSLPPVIPDEALARIEIPRIGVDAMVVPGVSRDDLKQGPGHFPDSPMPGQLGNSAIAGHRTTYGAVFNELDELEPDDLISVTRLDGNRYVYRVTETVIVNPDDYWVVAESDPTRATITLTTCHPETTASQRMAVFGELIADESGPVGEATFYDEPDAGVSVDIPATVAPSGDLTVGSDPTSSNPDAGSASTASDEPPSDHIEDAFAEGWFADREAWPQIAMWGGVLAAIAVAIYLISRRFRSYPIGVLVGVAPFVVTLYFFYQNVNRLLPAGL